MAIQLPDDIDRRLADLARKTGRTETDCAREAILMYIEDIHVAEGQLATSVPMIILFNNPAQPFPQANGGNNNFEIFGAISGRCGVYIFQDLGSGGILYVGKANDLKDRITQNYTPGYSGRCFRKKWCKMESKNFDDFKEALRGWRIITMSVASGSDDGRSDGDWIHALEAVLIGFLRPKYNKF